MAVTIKDLAKETGLGYATISAFLNGTNVRPANKEKIEKAIAKLGYIRNDYARALKAHSSKTIGVVIPELASSFATSIISYMEDELRKYGYAIIVCDCRSDKEIERQSLRFMVSKMVDGLIIMPTSEDKDLLDVVKKNNIPVVVIDRKTEIDGVSHIVINNNDISYKAVSSMLEKGRKRIALIYGGDDVYTSRERHDGYKKALDEYGLYNKKYIRNGTLSMDGGYKAMYELIKDYPEIDGIFVTNLEMTLGALLAVKDSGKKLPDDMSFTGFDLGDMGKIISQTLQSVEQPIADIGRKAGDTIVEMIKTKLAQDIILKAFITELK